MTNRQPINVRLPRNVLEATDKRAKATGTTRTALILEGLEKVLNGDASRPAKVAMSVGIQEDKRRSQDFPNGDQALIAERMRRLALAVPSTSQRRRLAIRELTEEGKLHG